MKLLARVYAYIPRSFMHRYAATRYSVSATVIRLITPLCWAVAANRIITLSSPSIYPVHNLSHYLIYISLLITFHPSLYPLGTLYPTETRCGHLGSTANLHSTDLPPSDEPPPLWPRPGNMDIDLSGTERTPRASTSRIKPLTDPKPGPSNLVSLPIAPMQWSVCRN